MEEEKRLSAIDKANVIKSEVDKQMQQDDKDVWISCMVRKTPKGVSIWIPDGAFK